MLIEGAKRLASLSPAIQATANLKDLSQYEYKGEALLPDFGISPGVNFEVGIAVAEQAVKEGSATVPWLTSGGGDVAEKIRMMAKEHVWVPVYPAYVYDVDGIAEG
jgi:malate dehydrogenase (oxaloacetate-decarboxylating)